MNENDPPAAEEGGRSDSQSPAAAPATPGVSRKPLAIRRVPKPSLTGAFDSPVRNLIVGVSFTVSVMVVATIAYTNTDWSLSDALYMVIITVFTVGYEEVRPIDTPLLSAITMTLIVLGCTSIIFLTGALVQFFTMSQLSKLTGQKRMNKQI